MELLGTEAKVKEYLSAVITARWDPLQHIFVVCHGRYICHLLMFIAGYSFVQKRAVLRLGGRLAFFGNQRANTKRSGIECEQLPRFTT